MYRASSSLHHSTLEPYGEESASATHYTPNSYLWPQLPRQQDSDWLSQKLLAKNGDPMTKTGLAIWLFSLERDMDAQTAFASLDGDCLIIPQAGALDIQTELGHLLVRQNEIAVIPCGIRYRVLLPAGPTRGYICEIYQGHFQLPELGAIGSTGLANVRDFQVPTAFFDGAVDDGKAVANDAQWSIVTRQNGRLWKCEQDHTPFDVAAWHGTNHPYKYDLGRFCVMGNMLFDEHDPSLYVVMTVPTNREVGTAVVDFAIIPPRYSVAEDTLWIPYYHRNTMTEFFGPIVNSQDPAFPFNKTKTFAPFVAAMNGPMKTHGATDDEHHDATTQDLTPRKVMNEGLSMFLLETENPLYLTDWATKAAAINPFTKRPKAKL